MENILLNIDNQSWEVQYAIPAIVTLFGLSFGSLATLLSWRIPRGEPIGMVRSHCPSCSTSLSIRDLFPLFSWLLSKGKCRHCKISVHWRYPLTEIITAGLFLAIYYQYGLTLDTVFLCLFATLLITMSVIDFEHYIIPDSLQWAMGVLGSTYHLAYLKTSPATLISSALIGLFIGATLKYGFLFLRKKDGLGMGDVKFLFVAGLWISALDFVPLMLLSGLLGIATGIIWRIIGFGERFPFGPALGFATFLLVLYPVLGEYFWNIGKTIAELSL